MVIVAGGIYIAEGIKGGVDGCYLLLRKLVHPHLGEEGDDAAPVGLQRLFHEGEAALAVQGVQRLQPVFSLGDDDVGLMPQDCQPADQGAVEIRHVAGHGKDVRGRAMIQPGVQPGQGPHAGVAIGHLAAGEEFVLFRIIGDQQYLWEQFQQLTMNGLDEASAPVGEQRLVAPHAAGLAAGKDYTGYVRDVNSHKNSMGVMGVMKTRVFPIIPIPPITPIQFTNYALTASS